MLSKLFLPLTIAAFLSNAGAVSMTRPVSTQLGAMVAPAQSSGIAATEVQSVQPNRWQLQVRPLDLRAEASRPDMAPVMVAALGTDADAGNANTRSSCYPALSFDTSSIPAATAGTSYSTPLTANGGQPPYRWSFGRSQLPHGFSIDSNGNLTGTPDAPGNYNFNVVVSDSLNNNVTGALTLTVNAAAVSAPVISSFSASPNVITTGSSTVLSWNVSNATTVTLSGMSGDPAPGVSVSPSATTTYVLTASNSSGSTSKTVTVTVNAVTEAPPVISSFSASPSVITSGSNTVLTWTVGNATTVTLSGMSGDPASGVSVSPSATTTYTLTASNSAGTTSKTVTVTVNPAPVAGPVISSFSASPSVITAGGSSVLTWTVSNATTVTLTGVTGSPASGVSVSPSATTAYVLTASNSSGTISKTVTVTVNAATVTPPVISNFSASPTVITAGSSSNLTWSVSNATTVTLSGVAGDPASGVLVTPTATTTYTLTATNSAGTTSKTVMVTVNAATPAAPVISNFSASPSVITAGSSSDLTWTVSNATTVTLSGMAGDPASGVSVSPSATTAYVLTATNSAGSTSATVTVTVNAAAATGTPLTACQDITKSGTYYLANDVSSTGTCFGIDADNITLNLNGHTVTYGTGGGTSPTPGIEGHDSWSPTTSAGGYAGTAHGGFEAYGGNVVESPNAAPFSSVFEFGEANDISPAPYIHDITATFGSVGAMFYYSDFAPPGARIIHNTINDNVKSINHPGQEDLSARSNFQGEAIYMQGTENNPGSGDTIENNTIIGSPQGGIRTVDQNSMISGNDVSMDAYYSNDYCFEVSADGTTVTNNNCHPISGRGVNIDASNVTISNNIINVTELMQNMEYGSNGQPGCELDGAYGVRTKAIVLGNNYQTPTGSKVTGNTITVTAGPCTASGVDFSYVPAGFSESVTGNTITTVNLNQGAQDYGLSFDDAVASGIVETGNTIKAGTAFVYDNWDGVNGITIGSNTWVGSPTNTVVAGDGGCDPSQSDSLASCPVSVTLTDNLPNKVSCGNYSEATVTIGGQVTQCKAAQ